ncbi:MAG TPA: hypothetical protein VFW75_04920 [Acetobacteraceae bacterium]|nr:hypothetical protein [Acetobacteraceae bacterium]
MPTVAVLAIRHAGPRADLRLGVGASCIVLAAAILACAALVGPDASWDLRNYHLYNGYAWLHGRIGLDLAPAQMQTFNVPLQDIGYVLLLQAFNHMPRLLATIMAVPHAVAVVLVLLLARRLLPPWQAFVAALIGATGAAALPTLATTMSTMIPAACVLGAVLMLVRTDRAALSERACFAAGFLGGLAVGLQLTAAPYALGLAAMLAAGVAPGRRLRVLLYLTGGGLVGAGCTGGFWWWALWQRFGDPVFPYFNGFFGSQWADPASMRDLRFMPRSVLQALFYPLFWAFAPQTLVIELPTRDPRLALGWIAVLTLAVRAGWQRPQAGRGAIMLPVFWAVSYVGWEVVFSILRYLVVLELLSGVLILLALRPLLARLPAAWQRACPIVLIALLIAVTVYPDWGRAAPGRFAVSAQMPPVPPGTLVVLLDPSPMAYVAAFAPTETRFVGASNNLIHPGDHNRLAQAVDIAIRTWRGPLWGLEMPRESPGIADATLRAYGLRRGSGCASVQSNLDNNGIQACPLLRIGRGGSFQSG